MKVLVLAVLFFTSIITYAQVGIGTTSPEAALDVNGNLRVRTLDVSSGLTSAKDSVLVVNNKGVIKRLTSKQVYDSHIKSFVKGTGSTLTGSVISSSYKKIAFDTETFDENGDYNNSTYEFTAPKDGIYTAYVQYELNSFVSAVTVGVAIFTIRSATTTLEAQEAYTSISALGVDISPPTRKTQTLLKLNAGDKIFFGASPSSGISLLSGTKSFFTIMQVE